MPTSTLLTSTLPTSKLSAPTLVLCDDHPVFGDALGLVLRRSGFAVEAIVTGPAAAVAAVSRHRPDACVIDRHLGTVDGLGLIGPVRTASPDTRVLMLTADADPDTADRALAAGAGGYLCKTAGIGSVVDSIRTLLEGNTAVRIADRQAVRPSPEDAAAHRLAAHLTDRERSCLALLVEGRSSAAIAGRLGVSVPTVRSHVQSVLTKLGVHSRVAAVAFAVRHHLPLAPPRGTE